MKVPMTWLREYVRVDASTAQIADALSISTAEVNGVERRGPGDTSLFRVGHVHAGRRRRGQAVSDRLRRVELRRRREGRRRAPGRDASERSDARAA